MTVLPTDSPAPNNPTADSTSHQQFRIPLYLVVALLALALIAYDYRSLLQFARNRKYIERQCAIGTQWSEADKSMRTSGVPTRKLSPSAVAVGYKAPPISLLLFENICRQAGSDAALKLGTWWTRSTRHIYLLDTSGTIVRRL